MSILGDLATNIVEDEFDGDTSIVNSTTVSGWLESHLGELNTLLNTSYSGANAALDLESQSILSEMYLHSYYQKQARNAARGILSGEDLLEIKDKFSSAKFTNKNEVAKVYRGLAADSQERLNQLVAKYTIHQAEPLQVAGWETSTSGTALAY